MDSLGYLVYIAVFLVIASVSFGVLIRRNGPMVFALPVALLSVCWSTVAIYTYEMTHLDRTDGIGITSVMRLFMLDDSISPQNLTNGVITASILASMAAVYFIVFVILYDRKKRRIKRAIYRPQ